MTGVDAETDATVTLRLPSSAAHVRTARLVAGAVARRSGVHEELLDEVRLAVGEACGRAVRLHERTGVLAPVTVEFVEGDRFRVRVIDHAPSEDGAAPRSGVAVANRAPWTDPSGDALGLALLGAVVQDLTVDPEADRPGSRVTMSWPLA